MPISSSSSSLCGHARGIGKTYKKGCGGVMEATVDEAMAVLLQPSIRRDAKGTLDSGCVSQSRARGAEIGGMLPGAGEDGPGTADQWR